MKKFTEIKGFVMKDATGASYSTINILIPFDGNRCNSDAVQLVVQRVLQKHIKTPGKFTWTYLAPGIDCSCSIAGHYQCLAHVCINANKKRRYKLIEELKGRRIQNKLRRMLYAMHLQHCVYDLDKLELTDYLDLDEHTGEDLYVIAEEF